MCTRNTLFYLSGHINERMVYIRIIEKYTHPDGANILSFYSEFKMSKNQTQLKDHS